MYLHSGMHSLTYGSHMTRGTIEHVSSLKGQKKMAVWKSIYNFVQMIKLMQLYKQVFVTLQMVYADRSSCIRNWNRGIQSVSCRVRSSVEQSSIPCHHCSISFYLSLVLNPTFSRFPIPTSDFCFSCSVPGQWLVISDTIIGFTFTFFTFTYRSSNVTWRKLVSGSG